MKVQRILLQAGWFLRPDCAPVPNAPALRSPHTAAPPVQSEYPAERRAAAAVPLPESPSGKLQNLSAPSVLFESSRFFYNTQETQMQNTMDPNFEIRIL